jgi:hypothetical protein
VTEAGFCPPGAGGGSWSFLVLRHTCHISFRLLSVYISPSAALSDFVAALDALTPFVTSFSVVCGDFNCSIGSLAQVCRKGRVLSDWLGERGMECCSPSEATHRQPYARPSQIDFVFAPVQFSASLSVTLMWDLLGRRDGHALLLMQVCFPHSTPLQDDPRRRVCPAWEVLRFNPQLRARFSADVARRLQRASAGPCALEQVQAAAEAAGATVLPQVRRDLAGAPLWLRPPDSVRALARSLGRARRRARRLRARGLAVPDELLGRMRRLAYELSLTVRRCSRRRWLRALTAVLELPSGRRLGVLCSHVARLRGRRAPPDAFADPEAFREEWRATLAPSPLPSPRPADIAAVSAALRDAALVAEADAYDGPLPRIESVSASELESVLQLARLPPRRSAGSDGVPSLAWVVALRSSSVRSFCAEAIDFALFRPPSVAESSSACLPDVPALTVMIPKVTTPASPADFRPITLLSTLRKLVERVALSRAAPLDSASSPLFHSCQFGFRRSLCAADAHLVLRSAVAAGRRRSLPLFAAFIDLRRAFDSVPISALEAALARKVGSRSPTLFLALRRLLRSEYSTSFASGTALSSPLPVTNGTPQGGVLSPFAFLALMDEGCDALSVADGWVWPRRRGALSPPPLVSLAFADDLVVFARSPAGLQRLLRSLSLWAASLSLQFGIAKCGAMQLAGPPVRLSALFLGGAPLPVVPQYTYLGAVVRATPARVVHERPVLPPSKLFACLSPIIGRSTPLGLADRLRALEVVFWPSVLHGCETAPVSAKHLDAFARRLLLAASGAFQSTPTAFLLRDLRPSSWRVTFVRRVLRFWGRCLGPPGSLLSSLPRDVALYDRVARVGPFARLRCCLNGLAPGLGALLGEPWPVAEAALRRFLPALHRASSRGLWSSPPPSPAYLSHPLSGYGFLMRKPLLDAPDRAGSAATPAACYICEAPGGDCGDHLLHECRVLSDAFRRRLRLAAGSTGSFLDLLAVPKLRTSPCFISLCLAASQVAWRARRCARASMLAAPVVAPPPLP